MVRLYLSAYRLREHARCLARPVALYLVAACAGVAVAADGAAPGSTVASDPLGALAGPTGAVIAAALLRGWTPTIRVIHQHEDKDK